MAKWSKDGNEVHVLIMAEGATSRDKQRDREHRTEDLSILAQSANQAADILGVKSVELLNYPDNRMDSVDLLVVVKSVEERIEKLQPAMVVTHHAGDLNIDHQITFLWTYRPVCGEAFHPPINTNEVNVLID
mgnify:CR=1 FL=1